MNPLVLDISEAAAALACSVITIRRLIDRGELRHIRVGRHIKVPRAEVERFVAGNGSMPVTARGARRKRPASQAEVAR